MILLHGRRKGKNKQYSESHSKLTCDTDSWITFFSVKNLSACYAIYFGHFCTETTFVDGYMSVSLYILLFFSIRIANKTSDYLFYLVFIMF